MILFTLITLWTLYQLIILIIGSRFRGKHSKDLCSCLTTNTSDLPFFSLIVPVKDEESVISRCLEALLNQRYPRDKMEIIIVDGNSRDATKNICETFVRKTPRHIKFIEQTGVDGKPAALNDGLVHVTGDIVGVFDADNVPEPDVLMKVAERFEDQSIKGLQVRTVSINEGQNHITKFAALEEKIWFKTISCRDRLNLFVTFTGTCQFIRHDVLMSVCGWREDSLAEDIDLALRLMEKGCSIKYESDVKSWQETPSSFKGLIRQRLRWYMGYLENLTRYGRLIKKPSRKRIDAEIILIGPGIMAISIITIFISLFQLTLSKGEAVLPSMLPILLTSLTLILIGLLIVTSEKPFRLRNLIWLPFIYLYWSLQAFVSCWAIAQLFFRRDKVWNKTEKDGTITEKMFLGEKT